MIADSKQQQVIFVLVLTVAAVIALNVTVERYVECLDHECTIYTSSLLRGAQSHESFDIREVEDINVRERHSSNSVADATFFELTVESFGTDPIEITSGKDPRAVDAMARKLQNVGINPTGQIIIEDTSASTSLKWPSLFSLLCMILIVVVIINPSFSGNDAE